MTEPTPDGVQRYCGDQHPLVTGHRCNREPGHTGQHRDGHWQDEMYWWPQTHECVFVEEQEPSGRLILCPCLVCGLPAMEALAHMTDELEQPAPTDVELALQVKDAALGAVRILGREVRALRARLAEAEER